MLNFVIIPFLAFFFCWVVSQQNRNNLDDVELVELKRVSLQDHSWFGYIAPLGFLVFLFWDNLRWITPYPFYFFMTIYLAFFLVIRVNINQAKLPPKFVRIDNVLFAIQMISGVGFLIFFIRYF